MSCPKGEIRRDAYSRTSASGKRTRVASTCIKDRGEPGKGPRTLPKLGDDVHLSKYGYRVDKPQEKRRESLKRAARKHGTLPVLRRTNLIANYSKSEKDNYKRLRSDVEFLKREYKKEK